MKNRELISLVNSAKYSHLFDFLVNIYLTHKRVRNACLIEKQNIINIDKRDNAKVEEDMTALISLCVKLDLMVVEEDKEFGRYLVSTPAKIEDFLIKTKDMDEIDRDKFLGKMLGFTCYNDNYDDTTVDRLALRITIKYKDKEAEIVEVCEDGKRDREELEDILERKRRAYNEALPNEFSTEWKIEEHKTNENYIDSISDLDYVRKHIDKYEQIFENYWCQNSKLFQRFVKSTEDPGMYAKYINFYKYLLTEFMEKDRASTLDMSGEEVNVFMENFDRMYDEILPAEYSGKEIELLEKLWEGSV